MASTAEVISLPAIAGSVELGPATVLSVEPDGVWLRLRDGRRAHATLALALPYEAREGDVVLAIGDGRESWVIGVVHGRGKTALRIPGDVEVHAVGGTLELTGDRGVTVRGRDVDVVAHDLRLVASSIVQKSETLYHRVRDLLSVHATRTHEIVDETAFSKAKSQTMLTEEAMTINGKQINLG